MPPPLTPQKNPTCSKEVSCTRLLQIAAVTDSKPIPKRKTVLSVWHQHRPSFHHLQYQTPNRHLKTTTPNLLTRGSSYWLLPPPPPPPSFVFFLLAPKGLRLTQQHSSTANNPMYKQWQVKCKKKEKQKKHAQNHPTFKPDDQHITLCSRLEHQFRLFCRQWTNDLHYPCLTAAASHDISHATTVLSARHFGGYPKYATWARCVCSKADNSAI